MSSYVNLLQDAEILYRSAARDKRSVRTAILGGVAAVLLVTTHLFLTFTGTTAEADDLAAQWKTGEAQYKVAKEREEALRHGQGRLLEAKGWGRSRLSIADFLEQLQALVPAEMQLTSIELTSLIAGVEGETKPSEPGPLPVPQRRYGLLLKGFMTGQGSEQSVLNFEVTLKSAPFRDQLALVKLRETARVAAQEAAEGAGPATPEGTRFTIDVQFKPRALE